MAISMPLDVCIQHARIIYENAAWLSGLQVEEASKAGVDALLKDKYDLVDDTHRPEAAANLLRVFAMALQQAQSKGDGRLHEDSVERGKEAVCPIYPFG